MPTPNDNEAVKPFKPVDLEPFKKAVRIANTGTEGKTKYNTLGCLNQAAWVGENAGCLIAEIEHHRAIHHAALEALEMAHEAMSEHSGFYQSTTGIKVRAAISKMKGSQ